MVSPHPRPANPNPLRAARNRILVSTEPMDSNLGFARADQRIQLIQNLPRRPAHRIEEVSAVVAAARNRDGAQPPAVLLQHLKHAARLNGAGLEMLRIGGLLGLGGVGRLCGFNQAASIGAAEHIPQAVSCACQISQASPRPPQPAHHPHALQVHDGADARDTGADTAAWAGDAGEWVGEVVRCIVSR